MMEFLASLPIWLDVIIAIILWIVVASFTEEGFIGVVAAGVFVGFVAYAHHHVPSKAAPAVVTSPAPSTAPAERIGARPEVTRSTIAPAVIPEKPTYSEPVKPVEQSSTPLGLIMLAFLLLPAVGWFSAFLAFGLLVWSILLFDSFKFKSVVSIIVAGLVLMTIFALPSFITKDGVLQVSLHWWTPLVILASYLAAGVVTTIIYLAFFNWRAKEHWVEVQDDVKLDAIAIQRLEMLAKQFATPSGVTSDLDVVGIVKKFFLLKSTGVLKRIYQTHEFNYFEFPELNSLDINQIYALIEIGKFEASHARALATDIAKVLPPPYKIIKPALIWAGVNWPSTLLWLFFNRLVRQAIELFMRIYRNGIDKFSNLTFGKV